MDLVGTLRAQIDAFLELDSHGQQVLLVELDGRWVPLLDAADAVSAVQSALQAAAATGGAPQIRLAVAAVVSSTPGKRPRAMAAPSCVRLQDAGAWMPLAEVAEQASRVPAPASATAQRLADMRAKRQQHIQAAQAEAAMRAHAAQGSRATLLSRTSSRQRLSSGSSARQGAALDASPPPPKPPPGRSLQEVQAAARAAHIRQQERPEPLIQTGSPPLRPTHHSSSTDGSSPLLAARPGTGSSSLPAVRPVVNSASPIALRGGRGAGNVDGAEGPLPAYSTQRLVGRAPALMYKPPTHGSSAGIASRHPQHRPDRRVEAHSGVPGASSASDSPQSSSQAGSRRLGSGPRNQLSVHDEPPARVSTESEATQSLFSMSGAASGTADRLAGPARPGSPGPAQWHEGEDLQLHGGQYATPQPSSRRQSTPTRATGRQTAPRPRRESAPQPRAPRRASQHHPVEVNRSWVLAPDESAAVHRGSVSSAEHSGLLDSGAPRAGMAVPVSRSTSSLHSNPPTHQHARAMLLLSSKADSTGTAMYKLARAPGPSPTPGAGNVVIAAQGLTISGASSHAVPRDTSAHRHVGRHAEPTRSSSMPVLSGHAQLLPSRSPPQASGMSDAELERCAQEVYAWGEDDGTSPFPVTASKLAATGQHQSRQQQGNAPSSLVLHHSLAGAGQTQESEGTSGSPNWLKITPMQYVPQRSAPSPLPERLAVRSCSALAAPVASPHAMPPRCSSALDSVEASRHSEVSRSVESRGSSCNSVSGGDAGQRAAVIRQRGAPLEILSPEPAYAASWRKVSPYRRLLPLGRKPELAPHHAQQRHQHDRRGPHSNARPADLAVQGSAALADEQKGVTSSAGAAAAPAPTEAAAAPGPHMASTILSHVPSQTLSPTIQPKAPLNDLVRASLLLDPGVEVVTDSAGEQDRLSSTEAGIGTTRFTFNTGKTASPTTRGRRRKRPQLRVAATTTGAGSAGLTGLPTPLRSTGPRSTKSIGAELVSASVEVSKSLAVLLSPDGSAARALGASLTPAAGAPASSAAPKPSTHSPGPNTQRPRLRRQVASLQALPSGASPVQQAAKSASPALFHGFGSKGVRTPGLSMASPAHSTSNRLLLQSLLAESSSMDMAGSLPRSTVGAAAAAARSSSSMPTSTSGNAARFTML